MDPATVKPPRQERISVKSILNNSEDGPPPLIPIPKNWMVGNFIDLAEDDEEENGNKKTSEWTRMNMLGEAKNILSSGLKFLNPQTAE
eukprot:05320.XXX_286284_289560_1 [CDS] Oithona nana genome sequencing.